MDLSRSWLTPCGDDTGYEPERRAGGDSASRARESRFGWKCHSQKSMAFFFDPSASQETGTGRLPSRTVSGCGFGASSR